MTLNASRTRPKRNAIGLEEERAWVSFYRRAGKDPAIAAEVAAQLEADIEMKREHLALYLCCRESLRLHQAREARNQRFGQFVRWLLSGLFVRFPANARRACDHRVDVLADLCERGFAAGVLPYYLHQLDRVAGVAHFEVPDDEARALHAALAARLSGYLVPKLVREIAGDTGKRPLHSR